jgi:dipeptidyl aminopeptidase/acylaminoacyl peptidase
VSDQRLRERMRDVAVPDERAAEERSWRVVRAAYEGSRPIARRRLRPRTALVAAAAALLAVALATSGTAIGGWLRDLTRPGREHAKPALSSLPGRGRLLVTSPSGPWVVHADGSKRLLGSYDEASWSPHGLFVISARGRQLVATEPNGRVRWTLARSQPVSDPRWSPSGYRIAYLTGAGASASLRVVAGDGTGDHPLAGAAADVAPAWRPGPAHVLAYGTRDGRVRLIAADTRRALWRSAPAPPATELVWSGDGRRLLAVGVDATRIFDGRGRLLTTVPTVAKPAEPAAAGAHRAAFLGRTHTFALIRGGPAIGQGEVALMRAERSAGAGRRVFGGAGAFSDVAWSPDGRWLLIAWPSADQWLFIRSGQTQKVVAISNVSRQFSPGAPGRAAFPRLGGWCCTPAGPAG